MPIYKVNLGNGKDCEVNVIASREEMEDLIQTLHAVDCGTTGYDFCDAYFMRADPEHVFTSTEHALWEIRRWLEEEKIETDFAEALEALPKQDQAVEAQRLRAAVNHPVITRVTYRFQPEYRLAIRRLLAGLASLSSKGCQKDDGESESLLAEHREHTGADSTMFRSAAGIGSETARHPNLGDTAQ